MATTALSSHNLKTFLQPASCSSLQSARSSILPSSSLSLPSASISYARSINLATQSRRRFSLVANATSTTAFSPEIGNILGDVSIFTASGDPVAFKDLWEPNELLFTKGFSVNGKPHNKRVFRNEEFVKKYKKLLELGNATKKFEGFAVVALLRHFGCVCCWELASSLRESKERLESAGVKLIAIGVGAPNKARILAERLPFPLESLYADPERKAYDVLGLYYGIGRTFFNPASAKVFSRADALKEAVKNYTIEATPDDISGVLQQGGMFVFKGKELVYAWKDEGTGDHAPMDDIFNLCCKVPNA